VFAPRLMLFQELLSEADRVIGNDLPLLPLGGSVRFDSSSQQLSSSSRKNKYDHEAAAHTDDRLTLHRCKCVVENLSYDGSTQTRIVRFNAAEMSNASLPEIPRAAAVPSINWERELQLNLCEASSEKERKSAASKGLLLMSYYSEARAARLSASLSRVTYNNEYVNVDDCFRDTRGDIALIEYDIDDQAGDVNESKVRSRPVTRPGALMQLKNVSDSLSGGRMSFKRRLDDTAANNRNRRLLTSISNHVVASSHRNTKPDLNVHELKSFHRPRMSESLKSRPWVIVVRGERKKGVGATRHNISMSNASNIDLNVASGDFILVEYFEENPPLVLNFGMSSIVLNYERIRDTHADQDERRHKSMQSTLIGDETYRIPRHVKLLMEKRDFKQIFEMDNNTKLTVGEPFLLETDDEFPFLGPLIPGEIQQSFKNELFRSPLYSHTPRSSDFLLTRTKIGKDNLMYSIRPIEKLFVSGQTEPLEVVPKPSKALSKTQEDFFLLSAARFFSAYPQVHIHFFIL
jgi:glycosyltransferase involved in cell wall biosynthesis